MRACSNIARNGTAKAIVLCFWLAVLVLLPALAAAQQGASRAAQGERRSGGVLLPPVFNPLYGGQERQFSLGLAADKELVGEPVSGFPNWQERVIHEWINRARVDPQADLAGCGSNCPENINNCYVPVVPLIWNGAASRASRFHNSEMARQNYFYHPSQCSVVTNIDSLYPSTCDGSASCACVAGTTGCSPCTAPSTRVALFGSGLQYEIIAAGYATINDAFYFDGYAYGWLWEPSTLTTCTFNSANGHRWAILKATAAVGTGYESVDGSYYTRYYGADFGGSNSPIPKIPSGAHYPQQSSSIDFWVNWYDTAAPQSAAVNVDGTCYSMTLGRGSTSNGAYHAAVSGYGSGCHRYYFSFVDSGGTTVTYPTTGSYGIGTTSCADWDSARPAACSSGPLATSYHPVTPCRVIDTRLADGPTGGPAIQPSGSADRSFPIGGYCVVPADAKAVSANLTVVSAAALGELTLYPADQSFPGTWTISMPLSRARANNFVLMLSAAGALKVRNSATGTVHMIIDVNGYFR
jgi:hypothetical protein